MESEPLTMTVKKRTAIKKSRSVKQSAGKSGPETEIISMLRGAGYQVVNGAAAVRAAIKSAAKNRCTPI